MASRSMRRRSRAKERIMPFDASHEQTPFPSEKARRLLEAHDREVGRNQVEKASKVEFARRDQTPYSEVA